ncbi:MAG: right-handed parallel beta-helix repeat-containing protein [Myxococcota bacterium]
MRPLFILATLAGCGEVVTTAVDVTIDADDCVRQAVARLEVSVRDQEGQLAETFDVATAEVAFPTGVRVVPRDEVSGSWRVDAVGYTVDGVPIVWSSVRGGFDEGDLVDRSLLFDDACLGVRCPAGEVCTREGLPVEGVTPVDKTQCVPEALAADSLRHASRDECPSILFVDGGAGTAGSDCGSFTGPCADAELALEQVAPGVGAVVHIRGEQTYLGARQVDLTQPRSGARTAPVVVKALPDSGVPRFEGAAASAIWVRASNVVLDGFFVTEAVDHGIAVNNGMAGVDNVTIRNMELVANGRGSDGGFNNRGGIQLNNGANDVLIEHSIFRDNRTMVADARGHALYVNKTDGLVFRHNGVRGGQGIAVHLIGSSDVHIESNVFQDNDGDAIRADGSEATISNNRICRSMTDGVRANVDGAVEVLNNTIVASGANALQIVGERDQVPIFRGNIFAFNPGTGVAATDMSNVFDSYNLYFMNGNDWVGFEPTQPQTNVLADPQLMGRELCELTLGSDSPARGAGPDGSVIGATYEPR